MLSVYAVVMSLCDSTMEDKIMAHKVYEKIKRTRNTLKIKQLMYSNGSELHTIHDQVMSRINLFWMRQERGQSVQNFHNQLTAMRQVCDQLGLGIGQTEGARVVLKKEDMTKPTAGQLKEAKVKAAEEFFPILFLYMANHQNYGKFSTTKKGSFPKKCD